jgi:hypothetical protein
VNGDLNTYPDPPERMPRIANAAANQHAGVKSSTKRLVACPQQVNDVR